MKAPPCKIWTVTPRTSPNSFQDTAWGGSEPTWAEAGVQTTVTSRRGSRQGWTGAAPRILSAPTLMRHTVPEGCLPLQAVPGTTSMSTILLLNHPRRHTPTVTTLAHEKTDIYRD